MLPTHYNTLAVEEEEDSSRLCVECEVPRELLPHTDQLMPPLEIGFEKFEENWIMQQCQNRSSNSRSWNGSE